MYVCMYVCMHACIADNTSIVGIVCIVAVSFVQNPIQSIRKANYQW